MPRPHRRITALLGLIALVHPVMALGQDGAAPACIAQREGMVACLGTVLCECRFQPGGSLTARPSGYRWDCGILRPTCGVVPPDAGAMPGAQTPPVLVQPVLPGPWGGGAPAPQPR